MICYLIAVIEFDVNMLQINLISWNGNFQGTAFSKLKLIRFYHRNICVFSVPANVNTLVIGIIH